MAASNDFQEERKILTTVFSTDADHSSAPNDVLFSDRFTIDDSANALLMNQNISDANTKQSTTDSKGMQANTSEKVWSSAALLSGYFHGKSLLNKPAKQDEFEDAMGKYGRRLLNRHYDIFKRNH